MKVIHRLKKQGFIAYITGAAVQNLLQGIPPKDFDIVTNARPGQIRRRFSNAYLIGRRFRLVHISINRQKMIEVATFRREPDVLIKDGPDGSIKRKSTYGTPREDAFRRDISINALFYDVSTNSVIDYVRGLQDLKERRIRIIGDPGVRYSEDPVRILRVVRHAARLGFTIEKRTEDAISSHLHLLHECSGARLYEELNKDLAGISRLVFKAYNRYGILKCLIGQAGEDYHADAGLSSRLISLLEVKDRASSYGFPFSQEELYALIFWPWVGSRFRDEKGDMQVILGEALTAALSRINVPRRLRSNFLHILILLRNMQRALRTGRMRQSWKQHPQYLHSSRLFFLIETGRIPKQYESFESLFLNRPHSRRHDRHRTLSQY